MSKATSADHDDSSSPYSRSPPSSSPARSEDVDSSKWHDAKEGSRTGAEDGKEYESGTMTQKHDPNKEEAVQPPPNGGYGWVCVVCCALINGHTWGINSSYGIFLDYYLSHNTYPNATRLDFAFVGGLSISMALLISPLATTITRLYGTRTTLLVGVFFETAALIGASFAIRIWQLFLSQGVCFGLGMGFLFVGSVGVIPQWFTTKRSFANACGAAGSGIGGLVYSLATNAIIRTVSLPWAFRILGICACVVNTTCAIVIRDRLKKIGANQKAFDLKLFTRPDFCLVQMWGFFSMLGYVTLLFSLPNYASSVGMTPAQASVIGAIFNLGQGVGRPPIGYFSDSFGRVNMAMTMTFLSGLFALVVWIFAKTYGVLIFYALIGGTVAGTFWATVAPVAAEVVGLKSLPAALSLTWLFIVLPCTFSEPMALEIVAGSPVGYLGTQLFSGFMYVAAALCLMILRPIQLRKLEEEQARRDSDEKGEVTKADFQPTPYVKRLFAFKRV